MKFQNMRIDAVLNLIAAQEKFNFSYNPADIDVSKTVSGVYVKKPVRELLNTIFNGSVNYKEKNGYLILQKGKTRPAVVEPKEWITFSGYVRDEKGDIIPWTSVYDKASMESTISNDYGFYKIRFHQKQLPLILFFSKQGYHDTTLYVDKNAQSFVNIVLRKQQVVPKNNSDTLNIVADAEETANSFFGELESAPNAKNISDTLYRTWQVSLLPYLGTNGKLGGNVINDYSFNVLGGYALGHKKLELSGCFNLTRGDASYVQLAGFFNLNGGNVTGVQMAGFTNVVKGNVKGVQMAGFVNLNWNNFEGAQFAGFVNTALDSVKGFQAAGFCNVSQKSMVGTQVAGFCNVSLDTLKGTQIGFVNYTRYIKGSQIGFLNIAQATSGVPVGFISYVHSGYHKFEIAADEVMPVNLAIRTGVTSFYNILTAGLNPAGGDSLIWNFGYGLGTSFKLGAKTMFDLDLSASQIVEGNTFEKINLLSKVYAGVDTRINKTMSLAIGVTVNGQITKTDYNNYPDIFTYYEPNIFYSNTWELEKTQLQMWLGAKVALRFF
ncbi:MAG: hypothetical protein IPP71_04260 [Bacteroidetes bacterium]|nr:hypothetical protein [Bacteroidota bacterium]